MPTLVGRLAEAEGLVRKRAHCRQGVGRHALPRPATTTPALRLEVEELLASHERATTFLEGRSLLTRRDPAAPSVCQCALADTVLPTRWVKAAWAWSTRRSMSNWNGRSP